MECGLEESNLLPRARRPEGQMFSQPLRLHGAHGIALSHFVFSLRHSMHAPRARSGGLDVADMME